MLSLLENTFNKFIQKKYPELIEQLELAKMETNKRQERLEEAMLKFVTAFKDDCDKILEEKLEKKLKDYGLIQ